MDNAYIGTKLKFAITISSPGFTIANDDFNVVIKRGSKSITFEKDDLVVDGNGQYYVCFDSSDFGNGKIEAIITAYVPDTDFDDNIRTEVAKIELINVKGL